MYEYLFAGGQVNKEALQLVAFIVGGIVSILVVIGFYVNMCAANKVKQEIYEKLRRRD